MDFILSPYMRIALYQIACLLCDDHPILTLSMGSIAAGSDGALKHNMNVRHPTRPRYISRANTTNDPSHKYGVIPRVSPTVPIPDATSKTTSVRVIFRMLQPSSFCAQWKAATETILQTY